MSGLCGSGTEKTSKFSHGQINGKLKYLNLYALALHAHVWVLITIVERLALRNVPRL